MSMLILSPAWTTSERQSRRCTLFRLWPSYSMTPVPFSFVTSGKSAMCGLSTSFSLATPFDPHALREIELRSGMVPERGRDTSVAQRTSSRPVGSYNVLSTDNGER
jgi:hypothetical protein